MGTQPLSSLITDFRVGLQNRESISDLEAVASLNVGQTNISRFHSFQELKRTAEAFTSFTDQPAVDKYLAVPKRLKTVHTLVFLNGISSYKLIEKPWRWIDKLYPSPESHSRRRPAYYARWGERFVLNTVPEMQYKLRMRYTADPTPFSITTLDQLSDFEEKDDIILFLALEHRCRLLRKHDEADEWAKMAYDKLGLCRNQDEDRPDMEPGPEHDKAPRGEYWNDPWIMREP